MRMTEADVLKRGYIYCPICEEKLYPEIPTFTDDTIYGMWMCMECENEFTITEEG